jgi:hypothetical protein
MNRWDLERKLDKEIRELGVQGKIHAIVMVSIYILFPIIVVIILKIFWR